MTSPSRICLAPETTICSAAVYCATVLCIATNLHLVAARNRLTQDWILQHELVKIVPAVGLLHVLQVLIPVGDAVDGFLEALLVCFGAPHRAGPAEHHRCVVVAAGQMPGIRSEGLLNHRTDPESRHDGAVRVPPDNLATHDLLGGDDDPLAGVGALQVNAEATPLLCVPFGIGPLNVDDGNVRHDRLDHTD